MKKKNLYLVFLILISLISCNTTDPPINKAELLLNLEDVSCTEAWITLTINNLQFPAEINLTRTDAAGNSSSQISILNTQDSLLYVDSLLPNKVYKIQASSTRNQVTSNELSVTTIDTTSHNFTFETWTFGDIGSSSLYDVAIINENNIWAVGDIKIADTSANGYTIYNAVHWDGNEWALHRIMFNTICGQPSSQNAYPASSIIAFSENEIWIAQRGDQIAKIENGIQKQAICMPWTFSINKIWGTSSSDLYVVGNGGNIAHYNGSQWSKIESGTDLQFLDIYGATDTKTGEQQILAVCTRNLPLDKAIYKIEGNTVTQISSYPIQWELFSLWFIPNRYYYVVGSGIYEKKILSDSLWKNEPLDITNYGTSRIRGNGLNDVFAVGAFGEFLHFNGITWKSYINETGWFNGAFFSVYTQDNLVLTVGYEGSNAKILLGRRIN